MSYSTIDYRPGAVARVILDRPERLNAQSWRLLREMEDAFNKAVADPECKVILLSGNGRSFSAGHDLDSPEQRQERRETLLGDEPMERFAATELYGDVYLDSHLRWRNLPKPTVAMVHGYCIYGGWMIASAMDFIFAAEDALLIPTYGDYFTAVWDLGPRKAKEVLYENKFMTAQEAMDWGFVNRVYPAADLERETLKYAARVAEGSSAGHRTVKFAINQTMDMMGFTTSVRSVHTDFHRMEGPRPRDQEGETPAPPAPEPAQPPGRFRNQVARAMQYQREDNGT
jgi:enoyl-CoA hydratase